MVPFIANRFSFCVLVTGRLNLILRFDRRGRQKVSPKDKYTVPIWPTEFVVLVSI